MLLCPKICPVGQLSQPIVQSLVKICLLTCLYLRKSSLPYCPERSLCCLQLHCCVWQGQEKAPTMSCWLSTGPSELFQEKALAELQGRRCPGTMGETAQVWLHLHAQSSNMIQASYLLSNEPTHGITPHHKTWHLRLASCERQHGGLYHSAWNSFQTLWTRKNHIQNRYI